MPKITAIIHTRNDARRLGRALESLRPCDEVLVVDHNSEDDTEKVTRQHGAIFKPAVPGVADGAYVMDAKNEWIFCLLPNEAVSEALEASLLEWKRAEHEEPSFAVALRKKTSNGWESLSPETRLFNRSKVNLVEKFPPHDPQAPVIEGDLLRWR